MSYSCHTQKSSRPIPRKSPPGIPPAVKSLPCSRPIPPLPDPGIVIFSEGDPVEPTSLRPTNGQRYTPRIAPEKQIPTDRRLIEKKTESSRRATPVGRPPMSNDSENGRSGERTKRESPYRKSQDEEELLNIIAETRPKAQMSRSPGKSNNSSYVGSPDRRRTPTLEPERVVSLELRLRDSTEKCKFMERQYKDLLTKYVKTEQLVQSESRARSRSDGRTTATAYADDSVLVETPPKVQTESVESLLRAVLDELKDLKSRMARIEDTIERLDE